MVVVEAPGTLTAVAKKALELWRDTNNAVERGTGASGFTLIHASDGPLMPPEVVLPSGMPWPAEEPEGNR